MKKILTVLILFFSLFLVGCNSNSTTKNNVTSDNTALVSNYDTDNTNEITQDNSEENDYDSKTVTEEVVEVPSEYDTFEGNTITESGKYYLTGEYSSISITAAKGSEVYLYLDGVTINSTEGIALSSSKNITLHVVLLNNSTNTITNDYEDTNAVHVKGTVYISGKGTINITSAQKSGLKVSKDLYIYEGVTLNITGHDHAISARSVTAQGATLNLNTLAKDGIHAECDDDVTEYTDEQGYVYLVDCNVTIDSYGDGIQADTYVYISGGEYEITTHGEFVSYSTTNMTEYDLDTDDFKFVKSGSTYKRVAKDEIRRLSSSYYALKNSTKGIKAGCIEYDSNGDDEEDTEVTDGDYKIYIAHLAKITINSTDDCIHTNYGDVVIDSANLTLDTFDDGIHADYDLTVNNASITVNSSYEGLEGATVTIDGENTNIVTVSSDDGINAASDLVNTCTIKINNGYLRVYASGDGLDANTALYLNGGIVIVEGPGSGNGSLDAEQIYFNGGIVFACSTSGMTERMSASQYTFLYQGTTMQAGSKVGIQDESGNTIFEYTLKQSCNQLIFSSAEMTQGSTYTIVSNGSQVGTVTMTSTMVSNSQGGGMMGPGGNPGGSPWGR